MVKPAYMQGKNRRKTAKKQQKGPQIQFCGPFYVKNKDSVFWGFGLVFYS